MLPGILTQAICGNSAVESCEFFDSVAKRKLTRLCEICVAAKPLFRQKASLARDGSANAHRTSAKC
jgi:hypothetical protein